MRMRWDAKAYDVTHGFVSDYGRSLEQLVPQGARTLLDLGCGTGTLTAELAGNVEHVIGLDSSPAMIEEARRLHPGIDFRIGDACALTFEHEFDVVFSNAVFHWIADHHALLRGIHRALRPGGLLVCEFGAHGNIACIEAAVDAALSRRGCTRRQRFNFPTDEAFRACLAQEGFCDVSVRPYDRPTPLNNGRGGLGLWLRQFHAADLESLPDEEQAELIAEVETDLEPTLWDAKAGRWVADYRRIRAVAVADSRGV